MHKGEKIKIKFGGENGVITTYSGHKLVVKAIFTTCSGLEPVVIMAPIATPVLVAS